MSCSDSLRTRSLERRSDISKWEMGSRWFVLSSPLARLEEQLLIERAQFVVEKGKGVRIISLRESLSLAFETGTEELTRVAWVALKRD